MSKALFRYLRGEINGYYLTNIHNVLNAVSKDIKDFIYAFGKMEFNLEGMSEENIYNIGRFAGVFLPRLSAGEGAFGSMRMTSSNIVGGKERSERGLMARDTDSFVFVNTAQDDYENDINTLADEDNKSSLVGNETKKGFIPSSATDVVTSEGDIDETKVVSSAPANEAYSDFYGNEFLYIEDVSAKTVQNIDISLFLPLYKVMQYIRYNGANIESLCKIISTICPDGYVKIDSINKNPDTPYFDVYYTVNDDVQLLLKTQRIASLLYIVGLKFPQFTMTEIV